LSCGKVLAHVFELHDEVQPFLTILEHEYAQVPGDDKWIGKLAYLSDIFIHLNELNRKTCRARMKMFSAAWTELEVS
jgi:hypothetical protein